MGISPLTHEIINASTFAKELAILVTIGDHTQPNLSADKEKNDKEVLKERISKVKKKKQQQQIIMYLRYYNSQERTIFIVGTTAAKESVSINKIGLHYRVL